jgi:arylsulfatase A-like enzyme
VTGFEQVGEQTNPMSRLAALLFVFLVACAAPDQADVTPRAGSLSGTTLRLQEKPNIIWIVADDLGYGDLGAFGSEVAVTPNIDRLAADGTLYSNAHVTAAICSPSRAGMLTGRHQARFGHDFNPRDEPGKETGLPLGETTIASRMQAKGYRTGLIGKWDLGYGEGYHPLDRGFDVSFGWDVSAAYILKPQPGDILISTGSPTDYKAKVLETTRDLFNGRERVDRPGYLTDIVTSEAVAFIESSARSREPFFLVVTQYAPHLPLQATARDLARVQHIPPGPARVQAAMIAALDDSVGAIMNTLEINGLSENTMIVFFSDNGCPRYLQGGCSNAPFSGFKRELLEGGTHIPMIAKWPGERRGDIVSFPVTTLDLGATAAALSGADEEGLEGQSLMLDPIEHRQFYWRAGTSWAIRRDQWKLLSLTRTDGTQGKLLFDLNADPAESIDVAGQNLVIVSELSAAYTEWNRSNATSRFEGRTLQQSVNGELYLITF